LATVFKFHAWLLKAGVAKTAKNLGVTRSAVYAWLSGSSAPRSLLAPRIVKLSRGALTMADVFEPYLKTARAKPAVKAAATAKKKPAATVKASAKPTKKKPAAKPAAAAGARAKPKKKATKKRVGVAVPAARAIDKAVDLAIKQMFGDGDAD
jgi:hypothetical protein